MPFLMPLRSDRSHTGTRSLRTTASPTHILMPSKAVQAGNWVKVPDGSATATVRPLPRTWDHGQPRDRAAVGVHSRHTTVHLAGSTRPSVHAARKAALLWSGGKDSALALHHARAGWPDIQIVKLVTCISQAYDRVSMHGVRRQLIIDQAEAIGLPVDFVIIPHQDDLSCPMAHTVPGTSFPSNDTYTRAMVDALQRLKAEGIQVIVFGDIFLEDLRAFRDRLLQTLELEGCYPLWGRDTRELYREFNDLGFAAITVCVDTKRLSEKHCGDRKSVV